MRGSDAAACSKHRDKIKESLIGGGLRETLESPN